MSFSLLSLLLFLFAVSLDSLTAGFSYGTQSVHIKALSLLLLSCIPAFFITIAERFGFLISHLLPEGILPFLSFFLLFILGSAKLLESLIRHLAEKYPGFLENRGYKIKNLNIIFTIYLSPEIANQEDLQILSAKEALALSLALSLDSILVGMAFTTEALPWQVLLFSAVLFNLFLFTAGYLLGRLLSRMLHFDLSWLCGLCLILLAFRALA